jgi:hypothetical protein
MIRLVLLLLNLSIVSFFSGFAAGAEGIILYLYYFEDTGITFTGIVLADWLLFIAFTGFLITTTQQLWKLRRTFIAAVKDQAENENRQTIRRDDQSN